MVDEVGDEELVTALAATAGIAIENARLYEESHRRQEWLQASTKITRQLLSAEGQEPLALIAEQVRQIADADVVTVVLPTPDGERLMVEVASGADAEQLTALTYPIENTLAGRALQSSRPLLVADVAADERYAARPSELGPLGPVMVLPLVGSQAVRGALLVGRFHGRHPFDDADLDMAMTFANHAALALELADARDDLQRVVLLEDRDRIARDLHDHVIQRLFATGLTVQSVASSLRNDESTARLARVVADLDETIHQIRTSIFQLRGPLGPQAGTLRSSLLAVVAEATPSLGFEPRVRFTGPIDLAVPDRVVDDVVAALREALSNVARHAHATSAEVEIIATGTELTVEVTDDGVGIADTERRSGLANLRLRAERHRGTLDITGANPQDQRPIPAGTRLRWTITLS